VANRKPRKPAPKSVALSPEGKAALEGEAKIRAGKDEQIQRLLHENARLQRVIGKMATVLCRLGGEGLAAIGAGNPG
jgi:hypothetical protein